MRITQGTSLPWQMSNGSQRAQAGSSLSSELSWTQVWVGSRLRVFLSTGSSLGVLPLVPGTWQIIYSGQHNRDKDNLVCLPIYFPSIERNKFKIPVWNTKAIWSNFFWEPFVQVATQSQAIEKRLTWQTPKEVTSLPRTWILVHCSCLDWQWIRSDSESNSSGEWDKNAHFLG